MIEVVQFATDRGGEVREKRVFRGGLPDQLRGCLNLLGGLSATRVQKRPDRIQARRWVNFPMAALRETLVNAVYHRGYDIDQPEPIKAHLFPGRVEVISYPGPVRGIDRQHLLGDAEVVPTPPRNRRIGEFLKDLGFAEGKLTGLPKVFRAMEDNGSPPPRFDLDEERTWFRSTLPIHPEFAAWSTALDTACVRNLESQEEALRYVEDA